MLEIQGIQPVKLGGQLYTPKRIDNEQKLRLQMLKFETEADIAKADDVLCSCFDDDGAKTFIREQAFADEKQVLAIYLTRGMLGLEHLNKATDKAVEKYMEKVSGGELQ